MLTGRVTSCDTDGCSITLPNGDSFRVRLDEFPKREAAAGNEVLVSLLPAKEPGGGEEGIKLLNYLLQIQS